ncbi:MAG: hypothetical protein KAI39_11630, partial [Desulfobulbaceae bacterium]|nr:hypothetical protein [Desulfobulbaceae bacterium]
MPLPYLSPRQQNLKTKICFRFAGFVTLIMILSTIVAAVILQQNLQSTLSGALQSEVNEDLRDMETRIEILVNKVLHFSKNSFVINSLIDPEGIATYLPQTIADFSNDSKLVSSSIVDFSGKVILTDREGRLVFHGDHLRPSLALGRVSLHFHDNNHLFIVAPIEYYNTPQGAVVAEYEFSTLADSAIIDKNHRMIRIFSESNLIYNRNDEPNTRYLTVSSQKNDEYKYCHELDISTVAGVVRTEYFKPVKTAVIKLLIFACVTILFALIISLKLSNSIAGPILILCEKIRETGTEESK